jgi:hypothetical protein
MQTWPPQGTLKLGLDPLECKNNKIQNHKIYCIQIDRLGHTVSSQKTIIQTNPRSSRYEQKRCGLVCTKPNLQVLSYISGKDGWIELSIFALKSCVLAGQFECNKPYNFKKNIFTL